MSETVFRVFLLLLLLSSLLAIKFCEPRSLNEEACYYPTTQCLNYPNGKCLAIVVPPGVWQHGVCLRPTVTIQGETK
jgi:hypothetical protein